MSNLESTSKDHKDLKTEGEECGGTGEKVLRHSSELLQIGTESCPSSLLLQKKSSTRTRGSLETFRPPPSAVLSSVKRFLPQLSAANEQLQMAAPGQLDIQNVEHCDGPVIEMDLALIPTCEDSSSSSSESSSEDEEEEMDAAGLHGDDQSEDRDAATLMGEVTEQNLRLAKESRAQKRPKIEELGGDQPKR
ncbi:C12orf45 [Branchiostoma lanceolatum]|uniref:C12orf45 protein n=1 Tax=Branchiostoma lanceolatum TaxID=7740 RepID=A0A8K0A4J4_BRALA|nr:C12orf45 [Branchiostoma lanceolatum]